MKTQTMYADLRNGIYDMTLNDVIQIVKENPYFTNPSENFIIGTDGICYTGQELLDMAGVKNECQEERNVLSKL